MKILIKKYKRKNKKHGGDDFVGGPPKLQSILGENKVGRPPRAIVFSDKLRLQLNAWL